MERENSTDSNASLSERATTNKSMASVKGGAVRQYQELVLGNTSLWFLIKFELIMLFSSWVPGALGLALRKFLYPLVLGKVGRGVVFGNHMVLRHPGKIFIGDNVIIDDNCLLDAKGSSNQGIQIGNGCYIGRNTILSCKNGDIQLGDNVNIGFNCEIFTDRLVKVGNNTIIAAYCYLVGGDGYDLKITDTPIAFQPLPPNEKPMVIKRDCWLGTKTVVLNGITIGEGAVTAAGAVLNKSVEEHAIVGGIPAKVIGKRS